MAAKKSEVADLTAPDPFLEKANSYARWVEKNLRTAAMVVAGLFLALVVGLVVSHQRTRGAASGTAELSTALAAYDNATDSQATFTATSAAAQEKLAKGAMPELEAIVQKDPKHPAAQLAQLYLADLARRSQDHARAEQLYRAYDAATPATDPLKALALEGLGYALEEQGKLDEAAKAFQSMEALPGKGLDDLALKHLGRVQELKGEKEAAVKTYRRLADEFPESKLHDHAEERISALE